jgi:hypothetical protein
LTLREAPQVQPPPQVSAWALAARRRRAGLPVSSATPKGVLPLHMSTSLVLARPPGPAPLTKVSNENEFQRQQVLRKVNGSVPARACQQVVFMAEQFAIGLYGLSPAVSFVPWTSS